MIQCMVVGSKTNYSFRTTPIEGSETMHVVCKMEESVFAGEKRL